MMIANGFPIFAAGLKQHTDTDYCTGIFQWVISYGDFLAVSNNAGMSIHRMGGSWSPFAT